MLAARIVVAIGDSATALMFLTDPPDCHHSGCAAKSLATDAASPAAVVGLVSSVEAVAL